jgi:RNA polymerase sigma factor (sigma-70 family)
MSDLAWIDAALTSARPQALAALLRYFRDLDTAEEAFQNACLRALKAWPKNGPPRDPVAWLVLVGRNAGIDESRKTSRLTELPPEDRISDDSDQEETLANQIDEADYRDDVLRLMFVCCHPDLPPTRQIALALRIVSGLSVERIARAFLVSESAMEQRITRAKARIASADVPFRAPDAVERNRPLEREPLMGTYAHALKAVFEAVRDAVTIPLLPLAAIGLVIGCRDRSKARLWLFVWLTLGASLLALVRPNSPEDRSDRSEDVPNEETDMTTAIIRGCGIATAVGGITWGAAWQFSPSSPEQNSQVEIWALKSAGPVNVRPGRNERSR